MQLLLIGSMLAVLGGVGLVLGQVATGILFSQSAFSATYIAHAQLFSDGNGTITLVNLGTTSDRIARISVSGSGGIEYFYPVELPNNTQTIIQFTDTGWNNNVKDNISGQTAIEVHLTSGAILTAPVVVTDTKI